MRKLVTIQKIKDIQPIPDADSIEKVRVKDWWIVSKKNQFKVGDSCIYFEIDSFLPDVPIFEFLKKGSTLKHMTIDGEVRTGIRLKTIKLRGQISQGLVFPLEELSDFYQMSFKACSEDDDISDMLGVIKYEPPIQVHLAGIMKGFFPSFIPKTDEERIQNMGGALSGFYVTEKLDGSSVTYYKKNGVLGVCSRNLELVESEENIQWRLAKELKIEEKLPDGFAIQGELIGEGIQKNPLKIKGQKIYFYNVYNFMAGIYLDFNDFRAFCIAKELEIVPIIDENFSLPKSVKDMLAYAEGKSLICPDTDREGVVVRPKTEMSFNGSRFSFKAISNNYLLNEE